MVTSRRAHESLTAPLRKRVENSLLRYTGEALHAAGVHLSPRSVSIGRCNINGPNKNGLLSRDRSAVDLM